MSNKEKNINKFRFIWGAVMVIIYLAISYILVFTPLLEEGISKPIRIGMAVLFSAYGIFRGYRLTKMGK